jgi:hypothetical protein
MTSLEQLTRYSSIDSAQEAWQFILKKFQPWQENRPSDYAGMQWDGYVPFMFNTGQSHSMDKHNYNTTKQVLMRWFCSESDVNETNQPDRQMHHLEEAENGHWACGYINYILLSENAPDELVISVAKILDVIEDNAMLDSDAYTDWEYEAICKLWSEDISERDKTDMLKKCKFTDEEIAEYINKPFDDVNNFEDSGMLFDYLREWLN